MKARPRRLAGRAWRVAIALGATSVIAATVAHSQEGTELGKREYNAYCAVCHGPEGRGDGAYAGMLNMRIPDLTGLAQRNNGSFPLDRVYQRIDGRFQDAAPDAHRMPRWGEYYAAAVRHGGAEAQQDTELFVHSRIAALAEYVRRLQVQVGAGR